MAEPPDTDKLVKVDWTTHTLGELIQRQRALAPTDDGSLSQAALGADVGRTVALIGAIERGERVPPLDLLARLADRLLPGDHVARVEVVSAWLAKWTERKAGDAAQHKALSGEQQALLREAAARVVDAMFPPTRPLPPVFPRSLAGFPEQFPNLVAVLPDRRETPPDSRADLFIQSGSMTDYMFFPCLQGLEKPIRICSDKLFVLEEDWLEREFGRSTLLVLGSSGVNWLTRRIAKTTLFPPKIADQWRKWDVQYRAMTELDGDEALLSTLWHLMETTKWTKDKAVNVEHVRQQPLSQRERVRVDVASGLATRLLVGQTETDIIEKFRLAGFYDSADGQLRGELPGDSTDYGVISLAPNPFDRTGEHLCIVCAGVSGPGTAHSLRALFTEQDQFVDRPFGGVIKVRLPTRERNWPEKFENAFWSWNTNAYTPEKMLTNLESAFGTPEAERVLTSPGWDDKDLAKTIRFVRRLRGDDVDPDPEPDDDA